MFPLHMFSQQRLHWMTLGFRPPTAPSSGLIQYWYPDWTHKVSQGLTRSHKGPTRSHKVSQGLTRSHKVPQGLTRSHMVSQGLTRSHKVPQGPKRSHKASQGLTRSHKVSQGLTWSHKVSQERIYFRSVWLGSDWFGFAIHDDDDDLGIQLFDN